MPIISREKITFLHDRIVPQGYLIFILLINDILNFNSTQRYISARFAASVGEMLGLQGAF